MKKISTQLTIVESITVLFTILFLYTAISKLQEYTIFKEQIATSPILAPFAGIIAVLLPLIELLVTLLLIIPKWRLKGLYTSSFLMIIFTIYIIAILALNKKLPCSCGGVIELLSWRGHIIFNIAFIILGILGIYLQKKHPRYIQENRLSLQ
jgi:hypothetical protein